jgi:signal transduction histidine kinase
MARRCRAFDWASTSLGAPAEWPAALRAVVRTCLESPFPVNLWCGPELLLIYNDAYQRVLGAKHPRALGRPGLEVWSDVRADVEPMFAQIRAGGPPVYAEDARFLMERAGSASSHGDAAGATAEAYFTFGLSAVRDEAGEIVAFFNPAAETTGRVQAERRLAAARDALELERRRLAAVFEQSPSFLAVLRGPDNVFELVNPAYQQIVGRGRPLLGRPLFDALPETRGQGFDAYLGRVRETGEPLVFRELPARLERVADAPIEERFIDVTYLPLTEADGTRDAVIAHGTDVTEQVLAHRGLSEANAQLEEQQVELELTNQQLQDNAAELEAQAEQLQATAAKLEERTVELEAQATELERQRAAAEEANRAKSQFLATMSHELRTPLNAIQGHVQLLQMGMHGPLTPQQDETLGRVDRAQRHLLGLINDILGYARLESGRVEYDLRPTPAADVVGDVLPIVEPLLVAKGLTFETRLPEQRGEPPVSLWADREKLGQVLLNLLSNAVKFTPAGGRVVVELDAGGSTDVVFLRVRDTGIGIPADKLEAVFEPFVQVRSAYAPGQGGTGLGLAISRDLARGMGGELTAQSGEGTGSTFTLTLRRAPPPA